MAYLNRAAGSHNMVLTQGPFGHTLDVVLTAFPSYNQTRFKTSSLRSGRCRKNLPLGDSPEWIEPTAFADSTMRRCILLDPFGLPEESRIRYMTPVDVRFGSVPRCVGSR